MKILKVPYNIFYIYKNKTNFEKINIYFFTRKIVTVKFLESTSAFRYTLRLSWYALYSIGHVKTFLRLLLRDALFEGLTGISNEWLVSKKSTWDI